MSETKEEREIRYERQTQVARAFIAAIHNVENAFKNLQEAMAKFHKSSRNLIEE